MSTEMRAVEGAVPFSRRVPWRLLLPPGAAGRPPLLVALHGKGDRAERFEAEARDALPPGWALLLPSGPVPRDRQPVRPGHSLGDSWYLYDGDTDAFRASLDAAEAHLLRVIAAARRRARLGPAALLGFSQGAYLAGVVGVRHPGRFRAVVQIAGRLKVEMLGPLLPAARGVRILGLHGSGDAAVKPGPSAESMAAARAAGLDAEFREFDAAHEFTAGMRAAAKAWLSGLCVRRARESSGGAAPRGAAPPGIRRLCRGRAKPGPPLPSASACSRGAAADPSGRAGGPPGCP